MNGRNKWVNKFINQDRYHSSYENDDDNVADNINAMMRVKMEKGTEKETKIQILFRTGGGLHGHDAAVASDRHRWDIGRVQSFPVQKPAKRQRCEKRDKKYKQELHLALLYSETKRFFFLIVLFNSFFPFVFLLHPTTKREN
jgi:hypothetical protein